MYNEFEEVEELPVSCVDARIDSAKYNNFKESLKQYEHLKEEQIRDLYSIYYKEEYEFNLNEDNSNFWWFKLLNKFNKQNIKVATKRNSFMCEELLPIFCDSLNYILKEKEEELKEQEKQNKKVKEKMRIIQGKELLNLIQEKGINKVLLIQILIKKKKLFLTKISNKIIRIIHLLMELEKKKARIQRILLHNQKKMN